MPRPFATHSDELMAWPTQSVEHVPRLLIVDDEPVNIHSLYPLFADDYEVFMATSGQEALAMCHQNQPDLVLLDVLMPDMDGLEVCRQLKAESDTAAIPVIFVTFAAQSGGRVGRAGCRGCGLYQQAGESCRC